MKDLPKHTISLTEKRVSIISLNKKAPESFSLAWSEITKAHAFKRDFFSIDCICIFLSRADDSGVELHEDMEGWKNFIEFLPKYLVGCQSTEQWLREVTFPPFEKKLTMIFSREQITPDHGGVA